MKSSKLSCNRAQAAAVLVGVRGRGLFRYVMAVAVLAVLLLLVAARTSTG